MSSVSPNVQSSGAVESPEDFGTAPEDQVAYWLAQDKLAEKLERKWIKAGKKIVRRYRDDRSGMTGDTHRYNVLWSNVQTLRPSLYNRTPKPDVERRFRDQDPIGRVAATILERACSNSLDQCNFDAQMNACVEDWLLPGRGLMRVLYVPHYGEVIPDEEETETEDWGASSIVASDGDQGEPSEKPANDTGSVDAGEAASAGVPTTDEPLREVVSEEVKLSYVFWEDYREGPARQWSEVPWIRYRAFMKRDELIDRFPNKGKKVNLDISSSNQSAQTQRSADDHGEPVADVLKQAEIWEIWDKARCRVIWLAPQTADLGLLDEVEDPLELPGFYPSPNPLLSTTTNDTRVPVADFIEYQDQAIELDVITARIDRLLRALKVSGVYAGSEKQVLQQLVDGDTENKLIPVEDWTAFATDKGGLQNLIQWMPIKDVAGVLIQLYEARDRTKQVLWEVTGMADIMRGSTNPSETATAQSIKAQFGTLRLSDRQRQVARFARDCIRLMAYVISGQFSPKTLSEMTGFPQLKPVPPMPPGIQQFVMDPQTQAMVPSPEFQQYQTAIQPIEQANAEAQKQFEAACQLLKTEIKHGFRIDIEADSTIAPDEQAEKQNAMEFLQAFVPLLQQVGPAAMGNPPLANLAKELTLFAVRRFRVARPLEEAVEQAFDQLGQMPPQQQPGQEQKPLPPDPAVKAQADAGAKVQVAQIQAAVQREKNQTDAMLESQRNQQQQAYDAADLSIKDKNANSQIALRDVQRTRTLMSQADQLP